jgi:dihydroorotate dehydrogenase (NAD+) catalytic subunit
MAFGLEPEAAAAVVAPVKKSSTKPLMVKLSPNAPDLNAVARACAAAGADALSLVNTFKGMAIEVERRAPVFDNVGAGLSGPAIRPIALRMVWDLWEALEKDGARIPLVGMGGIATANDALEFLQAGAAAVAVGSATFAHPPAMTEIIAGIGDYLRRHGLPRVEALGIRGAGTIKAGG